MHNEPQLIQEQTWVKINLVKHVIYTHTHTHNAIVKCKQTELTYILPVRCLTMNEGKN